VKHTYKFKYLLLLLLKSTQILWVIRLCNQYLLPLFVIFITYCHSSLSICSCAA